MNLLSMPVGYDDYQVCRLALLLDLKSGIG